MTVESLLISLLIGGVAGWPAGRAMTGRGFDILGAGIGVLIGLTKRLGDRFSALGRFGPGRVRCGTAGQ